MKTFITPAKNDRFATFFSPENIDLVNSLGETVWNESAEDLCAEQAADMVSDCDVYLTCWGSPRLDETVLAGGKNIKLMVHLGGTVVPYITDAVWEKGIRVISGNDIMARSVAEATVAYILTAQRRIPYYSARFTDKRIWSEEGDFTDSLIGKTVGLISYGAIARHLVPMLVSFGVRIMVYDVKPLPQEDVLKYGLCEASLEEIFSSADIVSLHTPLYKETYKMIDDRLLSLMKKDALFVNTARAGLVDEDALMRHLNARDFRAILDVYSEEPPRPDAPIFNCENVILIPHMGGPTVNLRAVITRELLLEAKNFIENGAPLKHEITREMAQRMSSK